MQFNTFFTAIVSYACIAGAVAAAVVVPDAPASSAVSLSKQAGCQSAGPFGTDTASPYITSWCTPGRPSLRQCQAMDSTGCHLGDVTNIISVEVDDPDDTVQYASAANINSVFFHCPSSGLLRCQVNLKSAKDGPSYTLRVI